MSQSKCSVRRPHCAVVSPGVYRDSLVTHSFHFGLIWASMVMLLWGVSTVPLETSVKHRMAEAG